MSLPTLRRSTDTEGSGSDSGSGSEARTRRRFLRRQWRRRLGLWKPIAALVLVVGLIGGAIWAVWFSPYLVVDKVEVTGTDLLQEQDVLDRASVPMGEQLARVDLSTLESRVESLLPVRDAEVTRAWPDGIRIDVTERTAVATVMVDGAPRGLDADGVDFRDYSSAPPGLPRVTVADGTSEEALAEAATVAAALPDEVTDRLDHIEVATIDQITLRLRDGRPVVWGSAEQSDDKARVLVALLDQEASSYDVSVPGQPTLRQ